MPLTYGTLWQRREVGMVPDFEEVRVIGTQLGRDLDMAGEIWEQQKTEQLLARGMSTPMVRFTVAIQLAFPGLKMTSASLRKHLTVSEKTAQAINNGQMVGFDDIRHVVGKVIPSKDIPAFTRQWNEAWDRLNVAGRFCHRVSADLQRECLEQSHAVNVAPRPPAGTAKRFVRIEGEAEESHSRGILPAVGRSSPHVSGERFFGTSSGQSRHRSGGE